MKLETIYKLNTAMLLIHHELINREETFSLMRSSEICDSDIEKYILIMDCVKNADELLEGSTWI